MAEGVRVCCLHSLGPSPYPLHPPREEVHEGIGWVGLGAGEVVSGVDWELSGDGVFDW